MIRIPLRAAAVILAAGLCVSVCASPDSVVVFNEVHYNPAGTSETGEWVELFNPMGIQVDVSGWTIDGIGYTFPANTIIAPGTYRVVAATPGAGQLGPFPGNLANNGETLRLINHSGRMMDELNYGDNDPWPTGPDNSGFTLAKRQPYAASGPAPGWTVSVQPGGTPGTANFPSAPAASALRFHEIQAANAAAGAFYVEIVNRGLSSIPLGGLRLTDDRNPPRECVLPAVSLPAGGIHLIDEAALGFRPANDDKLFLYDSGKSQLHDARQVSNRLRGLAGAVSDGDWLYPTAATPGTVNEINISSAVVISEIQYNPPALPPTPAVAAVYQDLPLFGFNAVWRYNDSNENLPADWASVVHPLGGNWKSGAGPIGKENDPLPVPLVTQMSPYQSATVTYYFEREFSLTAGQLAALDALQITHMIDDGAVFYINGQEFGRFNIPAGAVGPETFASPSVGVSAALAPLTVPVNHLVAGNNRISIEVHQAGTASTDLVFGIKLDARMVATPAVPALPLRESDNQWLEVANRSATAVDLGGWSLDEGISFTFPAGTMLAPGEHACVAKDAALFAAAYPSARLLGTFGGSLARSGELLVLRDANRNPVDKVRYFDGGQWPEAADGGGSSLELTDVDADNAIGGAWAASNESSRTAWKTYTYRATAAASNGPDWQWSEFNLGLLAAGEVWIDDVSVIENPDGSATQKVADTGFNNTALWRLRGNHRHSQIINEPGNPSNKILRLVATGPTEHMHNQVETTLASAVVNGRDYQISFRARWVTGINQLHTRLYFNRVPKVTVIDRPADPGTPGSANSRAVANAGPTFSGLSHSPAVPSSSQSVTVSAVATDPDGLAAMSLFYSVNGGGFTQLTMTAVGSGRYQATIPSRGAGSVVQFYLRGTDGLGAVTYHPSGGAASRALYKVADGTAATNGLHNFRIITTNADRDFMHTATEVMSNDRIECTVIDREGDIYYGAGVRLKSSQRGRSNLNRVGYNLDFPPDGLFRGVHPGMAIDRSEGQSPGQRELLFDVMISNSRGPISRYYDLIKLISPNGSLTGTAILQMARYDDVFLDSQFADGSKGNTYEYELVYYPTSADAGGAKLPQPDEVTGVAVSDLGDDPERYRWHFLNKINREADRFDPIINYCKLFSRTGADFEQALPGAVDLDNWFYGMACAVLSGAGDNAAAGDQHNGIYYARPDGRVIFLPHDLDFAYDSGRSIFANQECARLTADPSRKRLYLGHLHDIINSVYNNAYMSQWAAHFNLLDPVQDWAAELSYMTTRSNNVLAQINAQIPSVVYAATTPSPLVVNGSNATIRGTGWVNLREIRLSGQGAPLPMNWINATTWEVTVPVAPGSSTVSLHGYDFAGNLLGVGSVTVESNTLEDPAAAGNLVISEVMYHPAAPALAERNAGFTDPDLFEYLELLNTGPNAVNLTGVHFTEGVEYVFESGTLEAGGRILIVRDRAAVVARYPQVAGLLAPGGFLNGTGLANNGERICLNAADGSVIQDFSYGDSAPWPVEADGAGYSLVLVDPVSGPDPALLGNWRLSHVAGGNPGVSDAVGFAGDPAADLDQDGLSALIEHALGSSDLGRNPSPLEIAYQADGSVLVSFERSLAADDVVCEVERSGELSSWLRDLERVSEVPVGEGTVQVVVRVPPASGSPLFLRLAVRPR